MFKGLGPEKDKFSKGVVSIALLKTGDVLAGCGDGTVALVKPGTWKVLKSARLDASVTSVALRGDGQEYFAGWVAFPLIVMTVYRDGSIDHLPSGAG